MWSCLLELILSPVKLYASDSGQQRPKVLSEIMVWGWQEVHKCRLT